MPRAIRVGPNEGGEKSGVYPPNLEVNLPILGVYLLHFCRGLSTIIHFRGLSTLPFQVFIYLLRGLSTHFRVYLLHLSMDKPLKRVD